MKITVDIPELDVLDALFVEINRRLTALETAKPPVVDPPVPPVEPPTAPPVPPIIVTDPAIPVPPPDALNTRDFPGDDLGAKLRAIDEQLGDRAGSIILEPGTIATEAHLRPKRSLYLLPGLYPLVNPPGDDRLNHSPLVINDHTKIFGVGMEKSLFVEPVNGYIVIESQGSYDGFKWFSDALVTTGIELAHFGILGANDKAEGGVRSTIKLGNAHIVNLHHLLLRDTSCLGITAGGSSGASNCAKGWNVWECLFEGVASQALNVVNGRLITFNSNKFRRSGNPKVLNEKGNPQGMSPIDLEPNSGPQPEHGVPGDICQDIQIINNDIDSSESLFTHGNGILVQNGVGTKDYGPVLVRGNLVKGGFRMSVGIYVAGKPVQNVTVEDNEVKETFASLYRFEGGNNITARNNRGGAPGVWGSESTEIEVDNISNSTFSGFRLTAIPEPGKTEVNKAAKMRFVEKGNSFGNTFEDNQPAVERIA